MVERQKDSLSCSDISQREDNFVIFFHCSCVHWFVQLLSAVINEAATEFLRDALDCLPFALWMA